MDDIKKEIRKIISSPSKNFSIISGVFTTTVGDSLYGYCTDKRLPEFFTFDGNVIKTMSEEYMYELFYDAVESLQPGTVSEESFNNDIEDIVENRVDIKASDDTKLGYICLLPNQDTKDKLVLFVSADKSHTTLTVITDKNSGATDLVSIGNAIINYAEKLRPKKDD